MTTDKATARWLGKMAFEGDVDGHKITIDALPRAGGENRGARPKPLMLLALAGCTGMDVVSIAGKMRIEIENLNIIVSGEVTEDYPKRYHSMHVIYEISGKERKHDENSLFIAIKTFDDHCVLTCCGYPAVSIRFF